MGDNAAEQKEWIWYHIKIMGDTKMQSVLVNINIISIVTSN